VPELVSPSRTHGLVDVLDRVLDKGLVIAGDIKINLANVELLTIQVRLLVCSIDKAEQIGLNWWRTDPRLTLVNPSAAAGELGAGDMERRLQRIERQLEQLIARADPALKAGSETASGTHAKGSHTSHPSTHRGP
jgi:hypothetical protein